MLNKPDVWRGQDFEYVCIPKNGNTTIKETLKAAEETFHGLPYSCGGVPLFAVIRDPWERTISGLAYDLKRTYGYVDSEVLDEIDWERVFFQPTHHLFGKTTFASHSSLQINYLFDVNPNFYVDLKNLTPFLKIHFNCQIPEDMRNIGDQKFKDKLVKLLDSRKDLQDTIRKYLAVDYYFIERIRNTEVLWDFPMGKMW